MAEWQIPPEALVPPTPVPTPCSAPFWAALADDRIVVQRCDACGAWIHYPRVRCTTCWSDALSFHPVSGRAHLVTWTVSRRPSAPMFAGEVPQWLAVVELAEGVRLSSTLVGVDDDGPALHAGIALEPVFDHGADGATRLRFRPAPPNAGTTI